MAHILYVYGTLRPRGQGFGGPKALGEPVQIRGTMYDINGRFPGVILGGPNTFTAERIEVANLDWVDRYEGYNPDHPDGSLYLRRPYEDGFIYEFNRSVEDYPVVTSGDWLVHTAQQKDAANAQ